MADTKGIFMGMNEATRRSESGGAVLRHFPDERETNTFHRTEASESSFYSVATS